jgi:hypothetical protein
MVSGGRCFSQTFLAKLEVVPVGQMPGYGFDPLVHLEEYQTVYFPFRNLNREQGI